MKKNPPRPDPLPETEFIGEVQEFSVVALAPDDPCLEARDRKGRPADAKPHTDAGQKENRAAD